MTDDWVGKDERRILVGLGRNLKVTELFIILNNNI